VAGELPFQAITMNCNVSNEKAKIRLGWKPEHAYQEGIRKTIEAVEHDTTTGLK